MDYNDFRGITTLMVFVAFIAVVVWAYGRNRAKRFESAANSIFDTQEEQMHEASMKEVDK